jgi:hypothetical protein
MRTASAPFHLGLASHRQLHRACLRGVASFKSEIAKQPHSVSVYERLGAASRCFSVALGAPSHAFLTHDKMVARLFFRHIDFLDGSGPDVREPPLQV